MKSSSLSLQHWIVGLALGLLHSFLVKFTYERVPEPYMDEIFHVDQARRYCRLDFSWNNKITTPPALYALSFFGFCGRERYTNSFIIPFFYVGAIRFRQLFTSKNVFETAFVALILPVLVHSSLLFYTDLLSVTVILWAFSCKSPNNASLFFLIAVFTRQTNIVWAAVDGAIYLIQKINPRDCISSTVHVLFQLWSLILLAVGFVAFFVFNGFRVVLGDHSAHQPKPHFMQLYYLSVFTCFFAAPSLILSNHFRLSLKMFQKKPLQKIFPICVILCCIYFFTFEHPYLLADNRHFTFYIWRRWFRRHWLFRYLLAPFYLIASHVLSSSIAHINRYILILFILATAIALVPLPLIEPRYFIIPFILWRLSLTQIRNYAVILEIIYICFINIVALYLFYEKPFIWENEPNVLQRFMW